MYRVKEVAGLIGDLASTFQKPDYFQFPEIAEIVDFLKNSDDEEAYSIATWIVNCISSTMRG